ncbi:MAG: hypothetical protein WBX26_02070 [Candidatus Cybelea sp.]
MAACSRIDALRVWAVVTVVACTIGAASPAPNAPGPSLRLLARATNPNPTLNSYTASAQLSALLHAIIPIHQTFSGTVYYLRPSRKIEFQGVPGALRRFKDLASTTPTYEQATQQYVITPLTDNGTVSTYSLVPKKTGGRVKNVVISIGDASALLSQAQWNYTNRGSLTFAQTYMNVGSYRLPATATISARFPDYRVDGTLTFTNYRPNAAVSPAVFASPSGQ